MAADSVQDKRFLSNWYDKAIDEYLPECLKGLIVGKERFSGEEQGMLRGVSRDQDTVKSMAGIQRKRH